MRSMVLHKLAFGFDRTRNGLVFQGLLEDGYQFEILFPIGHVSMIFDAEMASLGYCGCPCMGYVETVDGFLGAVETLSAPELGWFGSKLYKSAKHAVSSAVHSTIGKVASQAIAVARKAVSLTPAGKAIALASGAVHGQNILKSAASGIVDRANLKLIGQYGANVPGIGTGVGALASGANAALSGQSLTSIAKATAIGAIPGGPLAQAAASAAVNLTQAGIEGHNLVKSAAGELINAAASMAPPQTQNLIRQTATAAIAGNNVLTAAQHAAIQTAIDQVGDPSARAILAHLATGKATPASLIHTAGGQFTARVVGSAPAGAVSKMLNSAATIAPATPHFMALSAAGLAAAAAGHTAAKLASAPPTAQNVSALARLRSNVLSMAQSGHPHTGLVLASLKSAHLAA